MAGDRAIFKKQCENGESQCWRLKNGQAYMLTRAEGNELVICCIEGQKLAEISQTIIEAAKNSGFASIRFHTKRPALARLINKDFELVEYIFKREL